MRDTRPVGAIGIGRRIRSDLGDLSQLMESMRTLGLLQPVVINTRDELVAGGRRLESARRLGWETIPVRVVASLDDAVTALRAEMDENRCRKELTPTEMIEHARRLEELERPKAKERQKELGRTHGTPSAESAEGSTGDTRDKVAGALGVGRTKLAHAAEVVAAAERDPEKFGDLPAQMDATGKVEPAYREMKRRQEQPAAQPQKPASRPAESPMPASTAANWSEIIPALDHLASLLSTGPTLHPTEVQSWSAVESLESLARTLFSLASRIRRANHL